MRELVSPTLRRRQLAAELRDLRVEHGPTEEQVAERLDWSPSKVRRIEKEHAGQTADGMRNREAVPILDDARFAADGGLRGSHRGSSRLQALQRFDQLRARIAALVTPHLELTLALLAIVDEAVLHRVVSCGAVMRVQLKQISTMIYLPNVTIQVAPFSIGAHSAMDSTFNILEFDSAVPSAVYVEGP
jgi:hypothetical protein